jgi:diguanylate cyclase (GGDEF)-like protein
VASVLRNELRNTDLVARYGGEEFVVLLRDVELEDAVEITERIRQAVTRLDLIVRRQRVRITISAGLTATHLHQTLDEAFTSADAALYRAKSDGRDRLVVHDALVS